MIFVAISSKVFHSNANAFTCAARLLCCVTRMRFDSFRWKNVDFRTTQKCSFKFFAVFSFIFSKIDFDYDLWPRTMTRWRGSRLSQ